MLSRRVLSYNCMSPCLNLRMLGLSICIYCNEQGHFFSRVTRRSCRRLFCLLACCWAKLMGLQVAILNLKWLSGAFKTR